MNIMDDLRKRAEKALQDYFVNPEGYSLEDIKKLLHELRVHQVELEMQNDELRTAQIELEVSQKQYANLYEKYHNLYDVAPVGYCTLEKDGTIQEINLTAADQLGVEKDVLLNTRIQQYIVAEDQEIFFLHLRKAFDTQTRQTCELRLLKRDGASFWVQLESIVVQENAEASVCSERFSASLNNAEAFTTSHCRTTITDITRRKQAEEQLKSALNAKTSSCKKSTIAPGIICK
jgi:PAS domain S-box-containing protein